MRVLIVLPQLARVQPNNRSMKENHEIDLRECQGRSLSGPPENSYLLKIRLALPLCEFGGGGRKKGSGGWV